MRLMYVYMDENDDILERIGNFYADLEMGKWTDFLSRKPKNFDDMDFNEKINHAYHMMEKIDKIMEEPWQVIKIWSRKKYIKGQVFGTYFDTFMEYELDYLTQKELEVQKPPKYRFLNWLYK